MTAAYLHAESGHYSLEMELLRKIDRFGVKAILGRDVLHFGELRRFTLAENIYNAYKSRARSENWAQWTKDNPEMADVLAAAEKLCLS
jgi:hypothetical protein